LAAFEADKTYAPGGSGVSNIDPGDIAPLGAARKAYYSWMRIGRKKAFKDQWWALFYELLAFRCGRLAGL